MHLALAYCRIILLQKASVKNSNFIAQGIHIATIVKSDHFWAGNSASNARPHRRRILRFWLAWSPICQGWHFSSRMCLLGAERGEEILDNLCHLRRRLHGEWVGSRNAMLSRVSLQLPHAVGQVEVVGKYEAHWRTLLSKLQRKSDWCAEKVESFPPHGRCARIWHWRRHERHESQSGYRCAPKSTNRCWRAFCESVVRFWGRSSFTRRCSSQPEPGCCRSLTLFSLEL